MDSLDTSFLIIIDGKPLSKPDRSTKSNSQATAGDGTLASLKLHDGVLSSGDWILGRPVTEDEESLGLKKVVWIKADNSGKGSEEVQKVEAEKTGEAYKLLLGGAPLVQVDGKVFVNLQQETSTVQVMMQSG